jgi:DNA-binding CsgD family transcriptional regulator
VTDRDIFSYDELRAMPMYRQLSIPHGFQWFAAIGFFAGPALWGLSIQRGTKDEPFSPAEARLLAMLSDRLTEVATLSAAVGRVALTSATDALDCVGRPAIAIDCSGAVLEINKVASRVFDDHIYIDGHGRLCATDARVSACLQVLFDRLQATPDTEPTPAEPIVIRRGGKGPLIIHLLPIHGTARATFGGARILLTFSPIESTPSPAQLISDVFGLTWAEAEVAVEVAQGKSLAAIAAERGIARVTVATKSRRFSRKPEHIGRANWSLSSRNYRSCESRTMWISGARRSAPNGTEKSSSINDKSLVLRQCLTIVA